MRKNLLNLFLIFVSLNCFSQQDYLTNKLYLSGHGCDDMVPWDFYCTEGRHSSQWTKIGVPSCWETQGFGIYQYGYWYNEWNKNPSRDPIANEKGLYKYEFSLPDNWKNRQVEIVFEAVMTDAEVKINGSVPGEIHQGGFSPFSYDITDKLNFGKRKNLLEVTVSKESSNDKVNHAERRADFWNFGGIIRPVYLISKPKQNLDRVAIDAHMDGRFIADCFIHSINRKLKLRTSIVNGLGKVVAGNTQEFTDDSVRIDFQVNHPELWTAETPNLYTAMFTLSDQKGRTLHQLEQRFGFRTIEIREREGIYINGKRVKFKGVNRHAFRPESGRTLSKMKNIEDVLLIKSLNMNAVRLSHYPADPEFYEACDSLGLYVLDEITGWQHPHDTIVGRKLVQELVCRDVNHPSIVLWDSGNEGGFNYALESTFKQYDIQKRTVIYPWLEVRNGICTRHYRSWADTKKYLNKGDIFMPTEFLHSAYDGGGGAGLYDYWQLMGSNPLCAGGFLWALIDEGVVRTDKNGMIDVAGNFGADGLVGPHFEKEGSYFTVKQIWSPVQISEIQNGFVRLENGYDFLNLNTCQLSYRYLQLPNPGMCDVVTLKQGKLQCPSALPHTTVGLNISSAPAGANSLELTVIDYKGDSLFTWSNRLNQESISQSNKLKANCTVEESPDRLIVNNNKRKYAFSKNDGLLSWVEVDGRQINLANGPRLIAASRADRKNDKKAKIDRKVALNERNYTLYNDSAIFMGFSMNKGNGEVILTADYKDGNIEKVIWTFLADGNVKLDFEYDFYGVVDLMGVMFDYPEEKVKGKSWVGNGPFRVWQNRLQGPQYGYWHNVYNDPIPGESFIYPEFKGYFSNTDWIRLETSEGIIGIQNVVRDNYIGIYQPRDGRDNFLYNLPNSGISLLHVIPAVRNKVDYSDLNGPSAQPYWAKGKYTGSVILSFE